MVKLTKLFSIGHQKEQQAKAWLSQKGINIIAENYLCKGGEIDLIGIKHQQLFFFEVKYRKQTSYGHPAETVTAKKQQRIIKAALAYQQKHAPQSSMRFDVIAIEGDNIAKQPNIDWIKNAFSGF